MGVSEMTLEGPVGVCKYVHGLDVLCSSHLGVGETETALYMPFVLDNIAC